MKITHSQLKEMVKEALDSVLNKEIVKFTADEMEELHSKGQIEKGDKVYQYGAPVQEGKIKPKLKITKKEWNKTHKDYKSVINGVHYIMKLTDKGTALVPVIVEGKLTEASVTQFQIPTRDMKNVDAILKKGRYKEKKDFNYTPKGPKFILSVSKGLENKILSLLVQKGIRKIHEV